jgi:protein phosphatase
VTTIEVDDPALIVLIGPAGSGKTTFATRHFAAAEILSSDAFRALLSGDEADQRRTRTVFAMLHREVTQRLNARRLVVVDATNVEVHARRALIDRAGTAGVPAIAIVLDLPPDLVHDRNATRAGRVVPASIVDRHLQRLATARAEADLVAEGFTAVHVLRSAAEMDAVTIERRRPTPA